jgi:hypothetical protein
MTQDEIKLAAALAGQTNRDLQGAVNPGAIQPREFLAKLGVGEHKPIRPVGNYEGMIEAPKATPAGTEIIGTTNVMPDLIELPDDLKKYVTEEPNIPGQTNTPSPLHTVNPLTSNSPTPQAMIVDILARVERIEQFILSRDKYWSKTKHKLKNKVKRKFNMKKIAPHTGVIPIYETTTTPITGSSQETGTTEGSPS